MHLSTLIHGQVQQLVDAADAVGAVIVYRHQGFLPNKRQLRMGGLAALEMAQTLRHLVRCPALPCCMFCEVPVSVKYASKTV